MSENYALQLRHITKTFPGVKALNDVSFDVRYGTVHSIVGENGAGKSTLMKIINGMHMDAIEAILTRKSVRKFTSQPIEPEKLHLLLEAAMSAPSATNARDWAYIVVNARETLEKMADGNGKYAQPLRGAAMGILICGDMHKAVRTAEEFWVIDGAIAAENLCLCAHALGLGAVWLGTWPREDAVKAQRELFKLPEHIIPHSILALGYPQEPAVCNRPSRYDASCVHMERW